MLYTDGVVEVRGESLDEGLERLRAWRARATRPSTSCATPSSTEIVADGRPTDDVAVLAARLVPLGDRLVTELAGASRRRSPTCATSCAAGCATTAPTTTRSTTSPSPARRRARTRPPFWPSLAFSQYRTNDACGDPHMRCLKFAYKFWTPCRLRRRQFTPLAPHVSAFASPRHPAGDPRKGCINSRPVHRYQTALSCAAPRTTTEAGRGPCDKASGGSGLCASVC